MFEKARIKLTTWYLGIIMLISIMFSVVIYRGVNAELTRMSNRQSLRIEREFQGFVPNIRLDQEILEESRVRLVRLLFLVNCVILGISGLGGYYLAGKTLSPIEEMLKRQEEFVANASHDLKTPITAMRSNLEVTLREKNISRKGLVQTIEDNLSDVVKLQNLSENLLTLSTKNISVLKVESLNKIISLATSEVAPLAKKKQITIDQNSLKSDITVMADANRLQRALVALVDNAIKYSREKNVIKIDIVKKKKVVSVAVIDRGMGIAGDELERVTSRVYRADNSRHSSGHGLGLSIASQIIVEHGSELKIASKINHGTTVSFDLNLSA